MTASDVVLGLSLGSGVPAFTAGVTASMRISAARAFA